jgi:hypothetical protein
VTVLALGGVTCGQARRIAREYFHRTDWDGKDSRGYIYYTVGRYRCYPGLGGSQATCSRAGGRKVLASARTGDGWPY